jgi:hypothetical protein
MAVSTVFRFPSVGLLILCFFPWTGYAQEMSETMLQYGTPESVAEFHGFLDLDYLDFQKEGKGGTEEGPGKPTFDQSSFYFHALAKIREHISVFGEVEYKHGGDEIKVHRAFLDWALLEKYLSTRLGKFYAPFGLEIRDHQAPVRKLISRPHFADELLFDEWTEVGVNAYGRIGSSMLSIGYDAAVTNGPNGLTGEHRQNRDNNSSRTVVGHLSLDYNGPVQISMGGSYATGAYHSENDLKFRLSGGDVKVVFAGLDIRGEYVGRKGDDQTIVTDELSNDPFPTCPSGPPCVLTTTETFLAVGRGYYGQISYRIMFQKDGLLFLEPVYRHDVFDRVGPNNRETTDSLGIAYAPYPHLVMRGEYQVNKTATPSGVSDPKDNGFLLQAVVDF